MRARVVIATLIALSAAHARAQGNLTGFTSRDCLSLVDVGALGGELYAVKYAGNDDNPDILFDATSNGGGRVVAILDADSWSLDAQWRDPVSLVSRASLVITLPSEIVVDNGDFSAVDLGVAKPQVVGAIDGIRPGVLATSWGYEVSFKALRQQTVDEVPGCGAAGDPAVSVRPIIGYNVYRLPGTGTPSLAQYRATGWAGFVDARTFINARVDADGLGCADGVTADEARLINPNGVMDDGDEIIVFRDTVRTPGGRARINAASPVASYTYRIQPVLRGDPAFHASGGTIGFVARPVTSADRDGNGSKESINLLGDSREEFVDPGMHGLGLTWGGDILSSVQPGQGTPLPGSPDPDADGIPTVEEIALGLDPAVSNAGLDSDGDGPLDLLEAESGALPSAADSDGSGERDGREMFYGRSPLNRCDDLALTGRPLGDVAPAGGGDGLVNVSDAVRMLRMIVTIEFPTNADVTAGDIAPAELTNGATVPPTWRRHGLADAMGQHPYGYYEHGDGVLDISDAVLILRRSVGLVTVTD